MSSRRSRLVGVAVALGVLAAAAPTAPPTAATKAAPPTAPAPPTGSVLRAGEAVGPSRLDPHRSTAITDIGFLTPVYDRLIHVDADGALRPGLATGWGFSEDGLTFTMTLREGVTFHDGASFDAAAVTANLERGRAVEGSAVAAELAPITAIETPDDTTVVLTLSQPSSMLPGLLSGRAGAMISPAAFGDPDAAPVGAGPYRVTEHQPGSFIAYERYDGYWDREVGGPDRIEVRVIPDGPTRLNALRAGEVDLVSLPGPSIPEAEAGGYTVDTAPGPTYLALALDRARPEFGELAVRRAINHAVNRQAIVDTVLFGAGETAMQPFPEGSVAHHPDYPGDHYVYDRDQARQLLTEVGLGDGFGFTMLVTDLAPSVRAARAVQSMLADVGVTVDIVLVDATPEAGGVEVASQGDAWLSQWGRQPDPQLTLASQFAEAGTSNPWRQSTPEFAAADAVTAAAVDPDDRADALRAEVAVAVEQALQVPIAHIDTIFAFNEYVTHFARTVAGQPDFVAIGVAPR